MPVVSAVNHRVTNSDRSAGSTMPLPSRSPASDDCATLCTHVCTNTEMSAGLMAPLWSASTVHGAAITEMDVIVGEGVTRKYVEALAACPSRTVTSARLTLTEPVVGRQSMRACEVPARIALRLA